MTVLGRKADTTNQVIVMTTCGMSLFASALGAIGYEWLAFTIPVFFIAVMLSSILKRRDRETRDREVGFGADGVRIDGEPTIPAAEIVGAFFLPDGNKDGGRLRVCGADGTILVEVRVDDEDQADELIAALGLDSTIRRAHFHTAPPNFLRTHSRGVAAVAAVLAGIGIRYALGSWPVALVLALCSLWFAANAIAPVSSAEIGVDGLSLAWLWRRRFVPFREIVDLVIAEGDVELVLRSGERLRIVFRTREPAADIGNRNGFILRMKAARARHASSMRAASLLARGERSIAEWSRALSTVREGSSYRDAGLGDEEIATALCDPSSAPDVRFAAAWLLGRADKAGKTRVRIAAETMAEPRMRVAIDRLTDGDDFEDAWTTTEDARRKTA